jgi:hypothetical protein
MPDELHRYIPLHRALKRSIDPEMMLSKAGRFLKCDLEVIRNSRRIPFTIKADRDLLVYWVWQRCLLTHEEVGRLFGMTYSASSRIINSMRTRLQEESGMEKRYKQLNSKFKI